MAKKEDVEELKDLVKFLENALQSVSNSGDRFAEKIISATRQSVNLKNVFEELVDNMEDLPKNILNAKDLQEAILKDARLFNKVQKETNNLTEKALKESWAKINKHLTDIEATDEEITKHREEHLDLGHQIANDINKQFLLLQRQAKEIKKIDISFIDVKKNIDSMGAALMHPGAAIDGMLGALSAMPNKIAKASKEAGGFGKLLSGIGKGLGAIFSPAGLLVLGFAALLAPIIIVFKTLTAMFDFIDKKVMPATANLNREFGNMGTQTAVLKKEAISAGVQFEYLGKSFEQGASAITDLFSAMQMVPGSSKRAREETKQLAETGLKLSEYVGLGAEASGKLLLQAQKAGISMKDFNKSMADASVVANKFGVPVNQIRRDMGENLDIVSRYGIRNRMVFLESAAKARSYGLSIKEVNAAFGETMDTFEGTSDVAAKLNTVFGTNINSLELMLETDPTKRMEMLREQLGDQGKEWDNLNEFEKNVIASNLKMDKSQLALGLSSKKVRDQYIAQQDQEKKNLKTNQEWEKGLMNVKEALNTLQPRLEKLMRTVANVVGKLFGMDTTNGIMDTTKAMENFIDKLDQWFQNDFLNSPGGKILSYLFGPKEKPKFQYQSPETVALEKQINATEARHQGSAVRGVNDALITKRGDIVKFHQDDNIMATKSMPSVPGKGGDTERIVKAIMSNMKTDVKVEVVEIKLDGKKVGEAQVRVSRL